MAEFPSTFNSPEEAYRGFFRADSAKNAHAWAAVMSYPHVRVSAIGGMVRYETPESYATSADWTSREATGWVRSEGITPSRIQETSEKVHLAGGWTRFNASDEPILENRVTYILTKINNSWGIQGRFGVDSYQGQNDQTSASHAKNLVEQFINRLGDNDLEACASLCRYPLTVVRIGAVITATQKSEVIDLLMGYRNRHVAAKNIQILQSGTRGAIVQVVTELNNGADEHGVVLVGLQGDRWLIAGTSHIAR